MTTTIRPSRLIYLRKDKSEVWRDAETAYEIGYLAGEADLNHGCVPLTRTDHAEIFGADDRYADGYLDAVADRERIRR